MNKALQDVIAERERQVSQEGWTPGHDDHHEAGAMAVAAACYALANKRGIEMQTVKLQDLWSWTGWSSVWWRPKGTRRNYVRAAALLLAEIERMDREEATESK